ncbi:RHS repeat-associated protein [Amycolatopsis lexingtonensis]|uniref:RHS repeat-associated protein n=1 Tax=Amycolatopsis lexingtonensis TaxID=218822 RepID=A0ABR9HYT7_9PSEU|nr:DUF6531 domain-containing protein [Amycolatopsis lexingtonensis]MBE1496086.1 RHS repeat-associated protein [Amycolatopsis lexingtonensis]
MSNPLIAQTQDSTKAYSGISLLESANDLSTAIKSGDWASVAMGAVGTALDALSMAMDPFGAILAAGVSWLMEHVGPLKDALNALTGNADEIQAQSETWANVAKELGSVSSDLTDAIKADLQSWSGPASDAYRQRGQDVATTLQAAQKGCEGASSGVKTAGEVVAAVRTLVRDIISELVGHLISWALQVVFTLGIGLTWVVPQVVTAVAKTASKITDLVTKLVKALKALVPLLKRAGTLFEDAGKALKNIKVGKTAPPPKAGDINGTPKAPPVKTPGGDGGGTPKDHTPPPAAKGGDDATHASGTGDGGSHGGGSTPPPPKADEAPPKTDPEPPPAQTPKELGDDKTVTSGSGGSAGSGGGKSIKDSNANPHENGTPPPDRSVCGDPIDVATGWMLLTQTDLEIPGALPLEVSRTHISSYRAGRWFGPSWASTVDQRLEVEDDGVHVALADGSLQSYPVPVSSPVLPVAGPARPLRRVEGGYLVEDPQQQHTLFFEESADGVFPLRTIADGDGNRIEVVPGANGVPAELVHSSGDRVLFDSAGGRITALRAADGTVVASYSYDARGRLAEVVDAAGTPTRFTYDADGRIVRWEDVNGRWYSYGFDAAGRVVRARGTGGYLDCTIDYDRENLVTSVTDSLGAVRRFHLDDRLGVIAETDALGHTTSLAYDEHGRLLTRTDPLGRQVRYERDRAGRVVAITAPDGTRSLTEYNEQGRPVTAVGPDGATWRYEYDARGKVTGVVDPLGARTSYAYDERGNVAVVTDALGGTTRIQSDAAGRALTVEDEDGAVTRYTYDLLGRTTSVTDELGAVTRFAWAAGDQLAERIEPDGATWRWQDSAVGNTDESTDARGNTTRTEYAQFDLPVAETGPDGSRLAYAYDTELRLVSVTNEQGLVWHYRYDPAGNLTSETDFNGRTLHYRYDAAGQLIGRTNGAGETTTLERDVMGQVVRRVTGDDVATFAYDAAGRMVSARNADAEVTFAYDALGRVVAETVDGRVVRSEYDELGRRRARHTPSGAMSRFEYGPAGTLAALHAGNRSLRFEHDLAGHERVRRFGTAELRQSWAPGDRLVAQTVVAGQRTTQHREYGYLADGYLASVADAITGTRTFEVDHSGRVQAVVGHGWQENYVYHQTGVIAQAQTPGAPTAGPREYRGTLLTAAGAVRYAHDPEGRTTLRGAGPAGPQWQFRWNAESRLTSVLTPRGEHWRYRYDALGQRVAKQRLTPDGRVAEQVQFAWDGDALAEQVRTGPGQPPVATVWEWEPGTGRALTQTERVLGAPGERFHTIVTDLAGTPSELLEESGEVAWHRQATLWGKVLDGPGRATTPLRFPGQYHDAETGLHYNLNRYYDPEAGRYLSHDPLGLDPGPDSQAYVHNPTALADPLGLAPTVTPCAAKKKQQAAASGSSKSKVSKAKQQLVGTGGAGPSKKAPKVKTKPDGNPAKSDGSYGTTKHEQARTWEKYQNEIKNDSTWKDPNKLVSGKTHESEHPIGYKAIGGDEFQRANAHEKQIRDGVNSGGRGPKTADEAANIKDARRMEDDAPAYQESAQAHRDNIGTGVRGEKDGSGFNADTYRESLGNTLREGRPSDGVQLNQLTYAHQHKDGGMIDNPAYISDKKTPGVPERIQKWEPNPHYKNDIETPDEPKMTHAEQPAPARDTFRPTAGTVQGKVADDSYHHMVDKMEGKSIEYSDGTGGVGKPGGTAHTPPVSHDDVIEMHTARDVVRDGAGVSKEDMPMFLHDKEMGHRLGQPTDADKQKYWNDDVKDVDMSDQAVRERIQAQQERMQQMVGEQRAGRGPGWAADPDAMEVDG